MKKSLFCAVSALVLGLAIAPAAQARDGIYIAVRGGTSDQNIKDAKDSVTADALDELDSVSMFSGAVGYKYSYFRAELEYTWRDDYSDTKIIYGSLQNDELKSTSYMLNAYIDFMPEYIVSPYISAGIGYTDLEINETTIDTAQGKQKYSWDKNAFTWSVGAGATLRINKSLNLDAGYRYLNYGKIEGARMKSHEWYGGLRYTF